MFGIRKCGCCGVVFPKHPVFFCPRPSNGPQGMDGLCRSCRKGYDRARQHRKAERIANDPEQLKAARARSREQARRKREELGKVEYARIAREKAALDRSVSRRASTKWKQKNRDRVTEYRKRNSWRYAAHCAKRRTDVSRATPPWLTDEHKEQILTVYRQCSEATFLTGKQHHVDHIFPLHGKTCSGLHVPWNLQVLPAIDNYKKNNLVG